ncbi:hypothetical protein EU404_20415 [Salmonella enterica subsp. enterica serovar Weltevreden]|nr:hypothetical protein [Salmonella enterica subsp. enterica serovar Weltevreden]
MNIIAPIPALQKRIKELEEEVLRLRQQRDAANAQLDFILENLKEELPRRSGVFVIPSCRLSASGH